MRYVHSSIIVSYASDQVRIYIREDCRNPIRKHEWAKGFESLHDGMNTAAGEPPATCQTSQFHWYRKYDDS